MSNLKGMVPWLRSILLLCGDIETNPGPKMKKLSHAQIARKNREYKRKMRANLKTSQKIKIKKIAPKTEKKEKGLIENIVENHKCNICTNYAPMPKVSKQKTSSGSKKNKCNKIKTSKNLGIEKNRRLQDNLTHDDDQHNRPAPERRDCITFNFVKCWPGVDVQTSKVVKTCSSKTGLSCNITYTIPITGPSSTTPQLPLKEPRSVPTVLSNCSPQKVLPNTDVLNLSPRTPNADPPKPCSVSQGDLSKCEAPSFSTYLSTKEVSPNTPGLLITTYISKDDPPKTNTTGGNSPILCSCCQKYFPNREALCRQPHNKTPSSLASYPLSTGFSKNGEPKQIEEWCNQKSTKAVPFYIDNCSYGISANALGKSQLTKSKISGITNVSCSPTSYLPERSSFQTGLSISSTNSIPDESCDLDLSVLHKSLMSTGQNADISKAKQANVIEIYPEPPAERIDDQQHIIPESHCRLNRTSSEFLSEGFMVKQCKVVAKSPVEDKNRILFTENQMDVPVSMHQQPVKKEVVCDETRTLYIEKVEEQFKQENAADTNKPAEFVKIKVETEIGHGQDANPSSATLDPTAVGYGVLNDSKVTNLHSVIVGNITEAIKHKTESESAELADRINAGADCDKLKSSINIGH